MHGLAATLLTVAEVAQRSGFAASALRYYEREGLIEATRTPGGQRRYAARVLRRLAFIRAGRNVGLSLEEIRAELGTLPDGPHARPRPTGRGSPRHWRRPARRADRRAGGAARRADSCIGCGCLCLKQCGISNPADLAALSDDAPGAAYLPPLLRRQPR